MTGAGGAVAVQAASEDVQLIVEQRLERLYVDPPSVATAAIAAHHGDQFSLGSSHSDVPSFGLIVRRCVVGGDFYCSSIGNRHVAIHSVGHGPIEQTVVIRQLLIAVQKRMVGRFVR